jgi:hypothetical protein
MKALAVALLLLLASPGMAGASASDMDRETLGDLGSLLVDVTSSGQDQAQVDVAAIKSAIESKLRAAGLTVHESVAEAREKSKRDVAVLVATISTAQLPHDPGRIVFGARLELKQMTTLLRDRERRALAITWSVSRFGEGSTDALRSAIDEMTDVFVGDYRAANPSRPNVAD